MTIIILVNVKITIFWPKFWSYLFFRHPVGPNKAIQSQAYMFKCKKSRIAQPCKRNIFFRRPIILINVKITSFQPKLWSYFVLYTLQQGPNKTQQSQAYMFSCKKYQIAQSCKRNNLQQTINWGYCQNHHFLAKVIVIFIFRTPCRVK